MAGMDDATPQLPACVVNCAAYGRDGHRRDIDLDAISDVLAVDDGSFVWIGLYEPDESVLEKLQEEFRLLPFGAVWDQVCEQTGSGVGRQWLDACKAYEKDVLAKR